MWMSLVWAMFPFTSYVYLVITQTYGASNGKNSLALYFGKKKKNFYIRHSNQRLWGTVDLCTNIFDYY